MMKIHLCCGTDLLPGYTNVDAIDLGQDIVADLTKPWDFVPKDSVDEFYCKDGFEHFESGEFFLEQAAHLLKVGGTLTLNVPHFKNPSAYRLTHKRLFSWNFWTVFPELHDGKEIQCFRVVENKIYIGRKESKLFAPVHWAINIIPKWWERLFYVSNCEVVLQKKES